MSLRIFLGAFGEPGHAFPMLALGERLAARGHDVLYETWSRWREHVEAAGMRFLAAPEYPVFPTLERPLQPYEAVVRATSETRPALAGDAIGRQPIDTQAAPGGGLDNGRLVDAAWQVGDEVQPRGDPGRLDPGGVLP